MPSHRTAVVIDAHEVTRAALRSRCAAGGFVSVVGESTHAEHGIYVVERLQPDVVIADLLLDASGSFPLPGLLRRRGTPVPVIAFTGQVTRARVRAAFTSGARGLVAKDAPPSVLLRAVDVVSGGAAFVDPEIAILMLDASSEPSTPLERDVLTATAAGRDLRYVAEALEMEEAAVRSCADGILLRGSELGAPPEVLGALAETLQVA